MFDAASRLHGGRTANSASPIPLLPQLVFSLVGQRQMGEFILNSLHLFKALQIVGIGC
jgi:hypothetical protein